MIAIKHIYETQNYNKNRINLSKNDLFFSDKRLFSHFKFSAIGRQ